MEAPSSKGLYLCFSQTLPAGRGPPRPRCTPEVPQPTQRHVAPGSLLLTCHCRRGQRPRCPPRKQPPRGGGLWRGSGFSSLVWGPVSLWAGGEATLTKRGGGGAIGRVERETHSLGTLLALTHRRAQRGPGPRQSHMGCATGQQGWEPQGLCSLAQRPGSRPQRCHLRA